MRILIAEDEVELAGALKFLLEKNRFSVDVVHDGEEALERFRGAAYDVIVLDIMMPGADGMEVLAGIRGSGSAVPVLMLTARGGIEDRVAGLEAGADDYLPKPFAGREFVARVKAPSRRNAGCPEALLSFGDVSLDRNRYMLGCGEQWVRLNNKEFQLAELFLRHPRFVFSTSHLMDRSPASTWSGRTSDSCAGSSNRSGAGWKSGRSGARAIQWRRRDAEEDAKTLHPGGHGGFRDGDGDAAGGNQSCKFL